MLLRLVISIFFIHDFVSVFLGVSSGAIYTTRVIPAGVAAAAGLFLLAGLWTPAAGALAAVIEFWMVFSRPAELWTPLLTASIASSLALIGPGAWSVDARVYGRKRISIRER